MCKAVDWVDLVCKCVFVTSKMQGVCDGSLADDSKARLVIVFSSGERMGVMKRKQVWWN